MEIVKLKISKVKNNPDNPRTFKVWDIENIVKSILTFPEMLSDIRPIAIRNNIVLGGNLRLKALHKILDMNLDDISIILAKHSKDKSKERIEYLISYWQEFQRTKEFNFVNADLLTDDQIDEFIIKDNVSLGGWDVDMLSSYNVNDLLEWGMDKYQLGLKEYDSEIENVELTADSKDKPPTIKITFKSAKDIDKFLFDISESINKYNATYSVSCGEL